MKSPFPGMDPYLESQWREVHHNLISFAQADLQTHLPADLRARIGERNVVELLSATPSGTRSDIYLPVRQGFIEIREAGSWHRVVTVIEFVSPTNKLSGAGRSQYVQKQHECLTASINLVEIDLVRRGEWVLSVPLALIPFDLRTKNQVCLRRGRCPNKGEIYRAPLRERLPIVPIPLRESEKDVPLDLQRLIDRCYEQGNYDLDLDYSSEPDPPLGEPDAQWADELLRSAGRR